MRNAATVARRPKAHRCAPKMHCQFQGGFRLTAICVRAAETHARHLVSRTGNTCGLVALTVFSVTQQRRPPPPIDGPKMAHQALAAPPQKPNYSPPWINRGLGFKPTASAFSILNLIQIPLVPVPLITTLSIYLLTTNYRNNYCLLLRSCMFILTCNKVKSHTRQSLCQGRVFATYRREHFTSSLIDHLVSTIFNTKSTKISV